MNWDRTLTWNTYSGKRDLSLDVVKALLIVLVVLGHSAREGAGSNVMNGIVSFIYHFHMPFFVLLCGYFFKFDTPSVMARKICLRYWLPYLSGGLLFVAGLWAFKGVAVCESLVNLMLGYRLGAMWFLYTIAAIETVLCISHAISARNRELGLLVAIGLFVAAIAHPVRVESWSVFYFLCGVLLKGRLPACRWGAAFGLLAAAIYCAIDLPWYTELSVVSMAFVACIGVLLRWCSEWLLQFRAGRLLARLGRWTIVILIFHPLFNLFLSRAAPIFASVDGTGVAFWIVEAIAGIAGSLLVGKLLCLVKLNTLFGLRA